MKSLGVSRVFSVSAVGSMKESIALSKPVLVDQFIDRTVNRRSTFFGDGIVGHVSMADPTCGALRGLLESAAQRVGVDVVQGGTYVCMEGPQFSSRAESLQYRQLGVDVIGMTNATEAKLAREAGICYATIAIPTDFDCWHRSEADVTVEAVIARLSIGIGRARLMVLAAIDSMGEVGPCRCRDALVGAIMTDPARISQQTKSRLAPILGSLLS
jgi:5'-methylthioadenosine phosphorylase